MIRYFYYYVKGYSFLDIVLLVIYIIYFGILVVFVLGNKGQLFMQEVKLILGFIQQVVFGNQVNFFYDEVDILIFFCLGIMKKGEEVIILS